MRTLHITFTHTLRHTKHRCRFFLVFFFHLFGCCCWLPIQLPSNHIAIWHHIYSLLLYTLYRTTSNILYERYVCFCIIHEWRTRALCKSSRHLSILQSPCATSALDRPEMIIATYFVYKSRQMRPINVYLSARPKKKKFVGNAT